MLDNTLSQINRFFINEPYRINLNQNTMDAVNSCGYDVRCECVVLIHARWCKACNRIVKKDRCDCADKGIKTTTEWVFMPRYAACGKTLLEAAELVLGKIQVERSRNAK